ncbi:MAG: hypothetical protein QOE58_2340 [Actinomycetota bacterium]|nr:hypothetical protein [Actinomycetota bacterium]
MQTPSRVMVRTQWASCLTRCLVGQVLVEPGLDHNAGAFVQQDASDTGIELLQDPGDDIAADDSNAGDLA